MYLGALVKLGIFVLLPGMARQALDKRIARGVAQSG
jgi:hypothetical protein